jgi:hypothetical protein
MAQFGRPSSDITDSNWVPSTGATLFGCVDETPAGDADYIRATGAQTCELKFSSLTDPVSAASHVLRLRAKATGSGGAEKWTVTIYQGASLIATAFSNTTVTRTNFADYSYTLAAAEANAITNYADLRVRIVSAPGAAETIDVSFVEIEVPDAIISLTIADSGHGHSAEAQILTQHNALIVQEAEHSGTDDGPLALVQHYGPLTLSEAAHIQVAEGDLTLVYHAQSVSLVVAKTSHQHISDGDLALLQHSTLAVQGSDHVGATDEVDLVQHGALVIQESAHIHAPEDDFALVQHGALVAQETLHGHNAEEAVLTQHHLLAVADNNLMHAADSVTVTAYDLGATVLTVAEAYHSHQAGILDLTQHFVITISDASHAHVADNIALIILVTALSRFTFTVRDR